MASFDRRHVSGARVGILVLGAVGALLNGLSHSAQESAAERQRQIVAAIEQEQLQSGVFSETLIEPLTTLALFYQEQGDHALAVSALERARQIVRVNQGFSSMTEAALLRQLVASEEARGNIEVAWDLEQNLLALIRQHPGDLRTVPILSEIGDKRTELLGRYWEGEFPPQIILGCYYGGYAYERAALRPYDMRRGCYSGRLSVVVGSILDEAQFYYTRAIDTLREHGRYSTEQLRALETQVLRNSYRYQDYRLRAYWDGRRILGSHLSPERARSASSSELVDGLIQMADWDVIFGAHSLRPEDYRPVLELYEQAYLLLTTGGIEPALVDELFSPRVPVVLPTFLPSPLVSEEPSESAGYIDVAFEITDRGNSEHIEILDTTNTTRVAEREIARLIKRSRFRPRLTDGQVADSSRVVVRYYLTE